MKMRHFLMKGNNRVEEKKERKVNFDGDQKKVMKAEGGKFFVSASPSRVWQDGDIVGENSWGTP